jgi:hypothetical protein
MTTLNQLSSADSLSDSDLFLIYSSTNGDDRKVSGSVLKSFVLSNASVADDKITQYAAPSATGFSITVLNGSSSVWLIISPTGAFAAGTLILPAVANCVDKQELLVNCTQAVTALTINANGATITGAPTTLAANGFFRLRFDALADVWYRVG